MSSTVGGAFKILLGCFFAENLGEINEDQTYF